MNEVPINSQSLENAQAEYASRQKSDTYVETSQQANVIFIPEPLCLLLLCHCHLRPFLLVIVACPRDRLRRKMALAKKIALIVYFLLPASTP